MGDAARAYLLNRQGRGGPGELRATPEVPAAVCLVGWTGAALPASSVLTTAGVSIDPAVAPLEVQRMPVFVGAAPASAADPVVITTEPLAGGSSAALARAVAAGLAVVAVDVADAAHQFAAPVAGVTSKLASATRGPARVLYKPAGTGVKTCVVILQGGGAEGPGSGTCEALLSLEADACLVLYVPWSAGRCAGVAAGQSLALTNTNGLPLAAGGVWSSGASVLITDTGKWTVAYDRPAGACCPRLCLTYAGPLDEPGCSSELSGHPNLTLTLTGGGSPGTYHLVYDPTHDWWTDGTFYVWHDSAGWHTSKGTPNGGGPQADATSSSCGPFTAAFGSTAGWTSASVTNPSYSGGGSGSGPADPVCLVWDGCSGGVQRFVGSGKDLCGGAPAAGCADNGFVVEISCAACGPRVAVNPDCPKTVAPRLYLTFDAGGTGVGTCSHLLAVTVPLDYYGPNGPPADPCGIVPGQIPAFVPGSTHTWTGRIPNPCTSGGAHLNVQMVKIAPLPPATDPTGCQWYWCVYTDDLSFVYGAAAFVLCAHLDPFLGGGSLAFGNDFPPTICGCSLLGSQHFLVTETPP
jgi:hypothetical protein